MVPEATPTQTPTQAPTEATEETMETQAPTESTYPPEVSEVTIKAFDSLDAFHDGILDARQVGPNSMQKYPGELETLEEYYMPLGLPEGYKLYQIAAGAVDIGFYYLPEEDLITEDKMLKADLNSEYYLFISGRQHDFDAIVADRDYESRVKETDSFRYYIEEVGDWTTVVWEIDGTTLMLTPPIGQTIDEEQLETLCKTQKYIVDEILP